MLNAKSIISVCTEHSGEALLEVLSVALWRFYYYLYRDLVLRGLYGNLGTTVR